MQNDVGDRTTDSHHSARRKARRFEHIVLLAALTAAVAMLTYFWWSSRQPQRPIAPAVPPPPVIASAPAQAPPAPTPVVKYPIEPASAPAAAAEGVPPLDESDLVLARHLEALLGRDGFAQLRMTGFVRHLVATVDNLARSHAPAYMWPVNPAAGRFDVQSRDGQTFISLDNGLRYTPLVLLAESVDIDQLAALYRSLYPLFQQAYEELGYPGRYFNDRLVEVIDHLLAAPEPSGPVAVELVTVQGPVQLARPWVHYTFADPQLESLSAGQKIMVRVGLVNERRLKARLASVRAAIISKDSSR
ncbi:MAG TPA: DUF3014 domain-containing protein [Burkholderiaceae bacterium]|nr:DUF3014 domain-containing protein [Burkholderiaceae bacterium]